MAQQSAPLYGRFPFPNIEEFTQRLQLVAERYLSPARFNSYLTTHDQQSFYGLDYEELIDVYLAHSHQVRSITTSAAGPVNRSVNINVRFNPNSQVGEGQYIIVTGSSFGNREVRDMLCGTWQPPQPEDQAKAEAIAQLLAELEQHKEQEEEMERLILAEEQAEEERKVQQKRAEEQAAAANQPPLMTIRDNFRFDDGVPAAVILDLLDNISERYFDGVPFHIRMITTDGEPYSNIGLTGLRRVLEKRRNLVLKVLADLNATQGEGIELALSFGPMARKQNAEVEMTSRHSREIRALVRESLEDSVDYLMPSASMVHEMFRFDQSRFSLDRSINLINRIAEQYLDQETPTAFLSTQEGKTYPALTLKQLRKVYAQYENRISFLLFGVNQSLTGQTFSLMFQFQSAEHEPYGSLSMMWGSEAVHQEVRNEIWRTFNLVKYQPNDATLAQPRQGRSQQEHNHSVFGHTEFMVQPRTCLVVMPLEAYWSDALWMHLQQTVRSMGWDSYRAGALYAQDILEDTWRAINEVEVLLADLTYKHPDVFYKLGLAHALGKKVILITQHARDLPPDFQRFPYIVYDNNIHGLQRLSERIIDLLKTQ